MGSVVLLAGTNREADAYRLDRGIRYAITNPTKAQVLAAEVIIELPGFHSRRDRFNLEDARDNRLRFGNGVQYAFDADWFPPVPHLEEPELVKPETPETPLDRFDFTDDRDLLTLKVKLNEVGYTLKKLPKKDEAKTSRQIAAEPVIVSDQTLKNLAFPGVEF